MEIKFRTNQIQKIIQIPAFLETMILFPLLGIYKPVVYASLRLGINRTLLCLAIEDIDTTMPVLDRGNTGTEKKK